MMDAKGESRPTNDILHLSIGSSDLVGQGGERGGRTCPPLCFNTSFSSSFNYDCVIHVFETLSLVIMFVISLQKFLRVSDKIIQ